MTLDVENDNTLEFNVNMTCGKCEKKVSASLESAGVRDYFIDVPSQKVLVTSSKTSDELREVIESTGKIAVLTGSGGGKVRGAAVAMLGIDGNFLTDGPKGVVRLTQLDNDKCVVEGTVDGLSPGQHGLAIHETGDTSQGCHSLGGHYNPRGVRHGSPKNGETERHVGDLGNISAGDDGRARFRIVDSVIKVWDVIGRSLVVSTNQDDLGLGGDATSLTNGNCGPGLACGVIARAAAVGQNNKKICACDGVTIWDERDKPLTGSGRRQQ